MLSLLRNKKGFTLLEILLVVAVISLIGAFTAPVFQSFQVRNDLDVATNTIVQSLRRAQVLSEASDGDTNWGVYIQSGSITLFKGTSYATRDTDYDEIFDMPTTITPSGVGEVVFDKLLGEPQTTGTITLSAATGQTKDITINDKGMVDY